MTDNIVKFPERELDIEVELDETEEEYYEMVDAINTMMEMHIAGIIMTSPAKWQHVMDAAMSLAVAAGMRSGMKPEEIEKMLNKAKVSEVHYDA